MSDLLILENLKKSFPTPQKDEPLLILDGIDLVLNRGESIAIQGKSGSGKSTLLSLAALLDKPTSGSVYYDGVSSESLSDSKLSLLRQKCMCFVFQNSYLLEDFSALENVAFPLLIQGVGKKTAYKKAEELLCEVQLGDRLKHRPHELSGGEKQRVCITRALITEPEIIFADEPTGSLDEESAGLIEDLLLDCVKKHEKALMLVTHNSQFASRCDRLYILENRKVHIKK